MWMLFKAFFCVVLSFLNIFTWPVFGFFAGEDNYKVKNEEEILLNFAAISDIHMTDEWARMQVFECGLFDMDVANDKLDALVLVGDLTDNGQAYEYENLKKSFSGYTPAKEIIMAEGNHDTWTDEDDKYGPAKENFLKYTKEISGRELENAYPDKARALIMYDRDLSKRIYASADIFVMPSKSEPCGLSQMIASRYGSIPVVRETGGLYDSIKPYWLKDGEICGNGFTFANYSPYELEERTRAAIDLWYNGELRARFVEKIMSIDFSWKNSAERYLEMYAPLWKK